MKQSLVVYNTITGKIKAIHWNKPEIVDLLLEENEAYIVYEGSVEGKYVVNGQIVPRPTSRIRCRRFRTKLV